MKLLEKLSFTIPVLKIKLLKKKIPLFISWELTWKCNQRCKYCNLPYLSKNELTTPEILQVIDEMALAGTKIISFSGGEPLIRKDLKIILKHTKMKRIKVMLVTNGANVAALKKILNYIDILKISFDGKEATHDYLRKKGSHLKVVASINLAKKYRIETVINTTLTMYNYDQIEYIVNFAKEHNIKVKFQFVNKLLARGKNINRLILRKITYKETITKLIALKNKNDKYIANSLYGLKYLYNLSENNHTISCYADKVRAHILPNGDIYMCYPLSAVKSPIKINSIKDNGFLNSFLELKKTTCSGCFCTHTLEMNKILDFTPSALLSFIK